MQLLSNFLNGNNIMRIIKAFLFGAVGLFIIITLFSLIIPSTVKVSRTVLINNTQPGIVHYLISNFGNWSEWHPIFKSQTTKTHNIDQYTFAVEYNNKQTEIIFTSQDSNFVKFTLRSQGENDIENEIFITSIPSQSNEPVDSFNFNKNSNVQVNWVAVNKLKWYPWEKFYGIFIDKLTGPGYEAALNGLKTFVEEGK